jgi:hypothetical protein
LVGSLISTGIATRVLDQSCAVSGLGRTELPKMFFLARQFAPRKRDAVGSLRSAVADLVRATIERIAGTAKQTGK